MTTPTQRRRHVPSDKAPPARHQHAQAPVRWRQVMLSGGIASVLSTIAVSVCSHLRVGSAAAGTNAASQWIWYPRGRHAHTPSWRHTVVGYLIHHASSVMWATGYEATQPAQATAGGRLVRATGIAALAYVVDYHLVPRRLSPGFEHKVGPVGMVAVYAAFAAGLWASTGLVRRAPRQGQLARQRQQAQHPRRHHYRRPHR